MSTQNKIDEIAEPLSKGEKAFKALHAVNPNKKLVPGITDQDHVFSGGERKLDKPTASLEIYKSEDESEEEYDKNLKAKSKEESFFASVLGRVLGEAGKQNWDKAHRDDRNEREGAKVGRKSMKPYRQPGEESKSEKRAGLSSVPGYKEALAKRGLKEAEDITDEELNEVLSKNDSASKWIHDFVHSDNPKFKGKSTKERQKMALGAYYAAQKEEVEMDEATLSAKAARAGKDIGAPGKNFAKIAKSAAARYGSKEAGEKVAGAVLKKMRANEEVENVDEALGTMANIKAATKFGQSNISKMDREEKARKKAKEDYSKMRKDMGMDDKATTRKIVGEDVEYDYEGEMAKTELRAMCDKADKLANMLSDDQQLEAWLQSKISKAKDYIDAVYDYMMYRDKPTVAAAPAMPTQSDTMASTYGSFLNRMGEEVEQVDEKMTKAEFAAQAHPHDKATFADKLALIKKKNPKADIDVKTEELELKSPALLKALNKVI
jgi:hypothetical protein